MRGCCEGGSDGGLRTLIACGAPILGETVGCIRARSAMAWRQAVAALRRFMRRDLLRAAVLRWMTPLDVARSSLLIAVRTFAAACSSAPWLSEPVAFLTAVRVAVRTRRLMTLRPFLDSRRFARWH